jgi:hypothetical protein
MSPTSYQTAPPRTLIIASCERQVKQTEEQPTPRSHLLVQRSFARVIPNSSARFSPIVTVCAPAITDFPSRLLFSTAVLPMAQLRGCQKLKAKKLKAAVSNEVMHGPDSRLVGGWSCLVHSGDGCRVRVVQRSGGFAASFTCRHLEQRMVFALRFRRHQLYPQLGIRVFRGNRFVDWSVLVDEFSATRRAEHRSGRAQAIGLISGLGPVRDIRNLVPSIPLIPTP